MSAFVRFASPTAVVQGWYCAGPASRLRGGAPLALSPFGRRLAFFRDDAGKAAALDGRCPHLGADLARGSVAGGKLVCGFHNWSFAGDGRCVACPTAYAGAPRPRARAYPVEERWGALWVWAGARALFALPSFPGVPDAAAAWALPAQRLPAHPHVLTMNGLDVHHFRAVHGLDFVGEPRLDHPGEFLTRLTLRARVTGRGPLAALTRRLSGGVVEAEFTTHGANLASIDGRAGGLATRVVFSHAPRPEGGSLSRTFLVAPGGPSGWAERLAVFLVMAHILGGDREVLDALRFTPNFAPADAALAAFAARAEALPEADDA